MANLIKKLRVAKGWSQTELGKKIGIIQQRVSLIEGGLDPKPREIKKLAKVFEIEPLLNGNKYSSFAPLNAGLRHIITSFTSTL
jgi:transcriptional regulator with XRE-family HTH domain